MVPTYIPVTLKTEYFTGYFLILWLGGGGGGGGAGKTLKMYLVIFGIKLASSTLILLNSL